MDFEYQPPRGSSLTFGKRIGSAHSVKSKNLKIRDCALLIGFDAKGRCVYSDAIDISSYYDGEHVWDSGAKVKKLKLEKVKGYLFDSKGEMFQEFESVFDLKTGVFKSGYARHADGAVQQH